jgi:hypothetical protein
MKMIYSKSKLSKQIRQLKTFKARTKIASEQHKEHRSHQGCEYSSQTSQRVVMICHRRMEDSAGDVATANTAVAITAHK